ncbi:MAG: hemerythrin domain-containing protein [Acidobacteriota bacterium]|nr:hemerythrin domain-containing protein [Acidobacteriota bacterium]
MPTTHTTQSKTTNTSKDVDATTLLHKDHEAVSGLFDQYEKARSATKKFELVQQICEELTVHAQIEEEIFYPAVRKASGDDDMMDEALVEHASLKNLIAQVKGKDVEAEPLFDGKITVLSEYVKHHVKEEEGEMFPTARKSGVDLKALGAQLQARKEALKAKA